MKQSSSKLSKGGNTRIVRNQPLKSKIGSKSSISYHNPQTIKQRKTNNQLIGKYLHRKQIQQGLNYNSFISKKQSGSDANIQNQKQFPIQSTSPNIDLKSADIPQKDRQKGLVFLNQPNISLIAQKPQGSSFMSVQHGDGSMDSMDRLIIGVTQFEIDQTEIDGQQKMLHQYYRQKEKQLEEQTDNIRDISNLNTSLQSKKKQGSSSGSNNCLKQNLKKNNSSSLGNANSPNSSSYKLNNQKTNKIQSGEIDIQNSLNSQELNFSRLRQQYEELIDRKKLFENFDEEEIDNQEQDWLKRQLQQQDMDLVEVVKQVSRNYKKDESKLKVKKGKIGSTKNEQEKQPFLSKNNSYSFFQRSHSQGPYKKGIDKRQLLNITDLHNIRRNLLNDSSSPNKRQLRLIKKLQQGLKLCRKVFSSKQLHTNSTFLSTVLGATQLENNSIRMLGGNLSQIHEERQNLNNNSMQIQEQNMIDRREIEEDLPGFVGLSEDRGQVQFEEEQIQHRQGQVQGQQQNNLQEMNLREISKVFPRVQQKNNQTSNKHNISVLTQNENSDSVMIILEKELKPNKKKQQNNSYEQIQNDKEKPIVQEDLQEYYEKEQKKEQFLRDIQNATKPFEQISSQNLEYQDLQKYPPVPNNLRNAISKNSEQNCILLLEQLDKGGKQQKKAYELLQLKLRQRQQWIKKQSKSDKWKQKEITLLKKMKEVLKNPRIQLSDDEFE